MKAFLGAAGALGAVIAARPLWRDWGATKHECAAGLSGDEFVPEPAENATRAITIDAPVDQVWSWLVQIGQDRGGMYSYDWVENMVGLDIHSTDTVRPEWQHLEVGDDIRLVPPGRPGLREGYVVQVARVEPPHTLVLRDAVWNSVWSFHLRDVAGRTRLITRGRAPRPVGAARVPAALLDAITLVMTNGMLHGIKRRAEADGTNPPFGHSRDRHRRRSHPSTPIP